MTQNEAPATYLEHISTLIDLFSLVRSIPDPRLKKSQAQPVKKQPSKPTEEMIRLFANSGDLFWLEYCRHRAYCFQWPNCNFAHSEQELEFGKGIQTIKLSFDSSKFKLKVCENREDCPDEPFCTFLHAAEETAKKTHEEIREQWICNLAERYKKLRRFPPHLQKLLTHQPT